MSTDPSVDWLRRIGQEVAPPHDVEPSYSAPLIGPQHELQMIRSAPHALRR